MPPAVSRTLALAKAQDGERRCEPEDVKRQAGVSSVQEGRKAGLS